MQSKRIALVTGANQGIGRQIARELVAKGLIVLVASRDLTRGEEAAHAIGPGAVAVQLDVTDGASIAAAAERVRSEFGHLDVLINNAAISNTSMKPGMTVEEYAQLSRASNADLNEMRAVWETNVFGVVAVTQAMLPLLRESSAARIINVSSGVGSLTANADPNFPYRAIFGPIYPASKTALNAVSLAFAIELEAEGIPVNIITPGFTKTNLNGFAGTETVEEGAVEVVRIALLGAGGPTATFTHSTLGTIPW